MSSEPFKAWKVPTSSLWMDPTFTSRLDVQHRIRSQSCGIRNKSKQFNGERTLSSKYSEILRDNSSELSRFFDQTNDQIVRMAHGDTTQLSTAKKGKSKEKSITLGDVCSLASYVANQISQKKPRIDSIRGFRYPSTPLGHQHQPKKVSPIRKLVLIKLKISIYSFIFSSLSPIRLIDILPKNDE